MRKQHGFAFESYEICTISSVKKVLGSNSLQHKSNFKANHILYFFHIQNEVWPDCQLQQHVGHTINQNITLSLTHIYM